MTASDRFGHTPNVTETNQADDCEHTLAGKLIGSVVDLLSGPPTATQAAARAHRDDMIAQVVATTVSMLPDMHFLAAGTLRAGLLLNPTGGLSDNAVGIGKNFAEGVALNGVARLSGSLSGLGSTESALAARPLLSQAAGGFGMGFGMSAVTAGFQASTWQSDGHLDLASGLSKVAKAGTIGGAIGIPAGLIASGVARLGGGAMLEAGMPTRLVQATVGLGSGYAAGAVFGGADTLLSGGSARDALISANQSGLIGAVTGGVIGGAGRNLEAAGRSSSQDALSTDVPAAVMTEPGERSSASTENHAVGGQPFYETAYDRWHIEPRESSLADNVEKLGGFRRQKMMVQVLKPDAPDASQFKNFAEFANASLTREERMMRIYKLGNTRVIVPDDYGQQLDHVLDLRTGAQAASEGNGWEAQMRQTAELKSHPLRDMVHPVDLVPLIESLPDRTLVTEVRLMHEDNPEDPWNRATYKPDFRSAATASRHGVITFYKAKLNGDLPAITQHEWSHLLKYNNLAEGAVMGDAAALEHDWHISDYSKRNDDENFAEHGQALIGANTDAFYKTLTKAPVRSALIGQTLEKALDLVPAGERSPYQEQLRERVSSINSTALPLARTRLTDVLSHSQDPSARMSAIRVLRYLGGPKEMELLANVAKTDNNPQVAQTAFDAAWQRVHQGDVPWTSYKFVGSADTRQAQIDFLIDMAQPRSRVRDLALEYLDSQDGARASNWYKLLTIDNQRPEDRLKTLLEIARRIPDQAGKEESWRQIKLRAGDREMQLVMAGHLVQHVPELRAQALDMLVAYADPRMRKLFQSVADQAVTPELGQKARLGLERIAVQEQMTNAENLLGSRFESDRLKGISLLGAMHDPGAITPLLERIMAGTPAESRAAKDVLAKGYSHQLVKFYAQGIIRENPAARSWLQPVISGSPTALDHLNRSYNRSSALPA